MKLEGTEGAHKAVMMRLIGVNCRALRPFKGWEEECGVLAISVEDEDESDFNGGVFSIRNSSGEEWITDQIEIPDLTLEDIQVGDVVRYDYHSQSFGIIKSNVSGFATQKDLDSFREAYKKGEIRNIHLISRSKEGVKIA